MQVAQMELAAAAADIMEEEDQQEEIVEQVRVAEVLLGQVL